MEFGTPKNTTNSNHESKPIRPENLEAMANAEIILEAVKDSKTKETDFIDENIKGFSRVEVENDLKRVELREEDFEKDYDHLTEDEIKRIKIGEKRGKALETIIVSVAGKRNEHDEARYDWYGKDAYVMETAKFDDICNGVDGVWNSMWEKESHIKSHWQSMLQ